MPHRNYRKPFWIYFPSIRIEVFTTPAYATDQRREQQNDDAQSQIVPIEFAPRTDIRTSVCPTHEEIFICRFSCCLALFHCTFSLFPRSRIGFFSSRSFQFEDKLIENDDRSLD